MEHPTISSHLNLVSRIAELQAEKTRQEAALTQNFTEVIHSFGPESFVQETVHQLVTNEDVQIKLTKTGLNLLSKFIFDRIFGRDKSAKGYMAAVLAEQVSGIIIENNAAAIVSGVRKMLDQDSRQN